MGREHVRLEIVDGGAKTALVDLPPGGQWVLGRHHTCDIVLSGNGISRHHALLIVHKDERVIHDLGSRNGTYLNGRELREAHAQVAHGDTVRVGPSLLLKVSVTEEPIEKALEKLEPPKRYVPKSGAREVLRAAERARHCEACDKTLSPETASPSSRSAKALWLDDGAIVCGACAPTLGSRQRIAGRYRVLAKLGEGGVATVMKVIDEAVRRVVALKIMKSASADLASAYLEREIEILRDLDHPSIVRLLDAGEHEGARFFVMDLVRGADLASIIENRGHVPAAHAALVGFRIASALSLAHRRGVVHRDVKPSNVLVERTGLARLADFGVARSAPLAAKRKGKGMTVRGARRGTPAYMAPEQARDPGSAGPAADVYGLGATLYHAIQGEPPYGKDASPAQILEKLDKGVPAAEFSGSESSANIGLTDAIRRCMAHDPKQRFPDAEALRSALVGFVDGGTDPSLLLLPV